MNFHPELFEQRAQALDALNEAGICWLSDFSAIDPDHDREGLSVTGVVNEQTANAVRQILGHLFPCWRYIRFWHKDRGLDVGWQVDIAAHDDRDATGWGL